MPIRVSVNIKIGTIDKSSDTNVRVSDPEFAFDHESSPCSELVALVNKRVMPCLQEHGRRTIRNDHTLYLRPTPTSPQNDFVGLHEDNFLHCIETSMQRARNSRKTKDAPFVCALQRQQQLTTISLLVLKSKLHVLIAL
ncbi:TPA: hypothetical protein N0F65_002612 [Lagenidium giganteum]|uniref:Uncharacterized protein n=1 Tax=Lagenidium giganteum TaxID=4803 RepID=A0AAV2YV22_9STRA|nr:TPA: hypothetical protein N0F65_002612 [Lagenidium giganteum]